MTPTSPAALLGPDLSRPLATSPLSAGQARTRTQIDKTARDFESQVTAVMFQTLFSQMPVSEEWGGGRGEEMFRSFLTEAMAKKMSTGRGIGLADDVARQMLKMQGLTP